MLQELLKAFALIFIAEMGDKTQILAMAFATRYPVKKVLAGIFAGILLNHGLAVVLGSYISYFIPINTIQIIAGFAFVGFSLWTLKTESEDEDEKEKKSKFGPVVTVALAFFIGELGDKTQLTAITLAADASYPLFILCGTVLGMMVTGGVGIVVGMKLGDKIPELAIKIIAAAVFMFFGVTKLYNTLPDQYITLQNIIAFFAVISVAAYLMLRPMLIMRRQGISSLYQKKSKELYEYYRQIEKTLDNVCLSTKVCGECQGNKCIVGSTKTLIKNGLDDNGNLKHEEFNINNDTLNKHFDKEEALTALRLTLELLRKDSDNTDNDNINEIRKNLEMILFGESVSSIEDWDEYQKRLKRLDEIAADKILH
ncbi:MAG TPA: TMEM165/GDT1 family protein [Clostridiales bacterium]|nr:TMEM165/GDT1 family protein [Clostridiales bacterium]